MTPLFTSDSLAKLAESEALFRGFTRSWEFDLPRELDEVSRAFARRKYVVQAKVDRFIASKKADYLLATQARSQGLTATLNNEAETQDTAFDFSVTLRSNGLTRYETKLMQNGVRDLEITLLYPFTQTQACMKWKDYDVFVAWCVTTENMFRPWALLSSRLFASDMWELIWTLNNGSKGGKHLSLGTLTKPYIDGVVIL